MRILITGMDAPWINTGFANTLRAIGGELLRRGHEVYSICGNFTFNTDGPINHDGLIVLSNKGMMYPDRDIFLKHYDEVKPDVVIAHNDFYRIKYVAELPQKIIDKTIVWLPIEDTDSFGDLDNLRKLKNLAFTTQYGINLYNRLLPGQRLFHINHQIGISEKPEIIESLAANPKLNNKFAILRVDRNQERKDWPSTLKSFQSFIKNDYIKDSILIAKTRKRDVASSVDLGELCIELGIEDNVVFVEDELNPSQMRWLYEQANVFLSTTGSEGFGLSIGEAMSCSKPIVCTGCSPLFDVVGSGAGSFIKVAGKNYNNNVFVYYNQVDIKDASRLLREYYDDWKLGGVRIKSEGEVARINSNAYKVERVVDEWEKVFEVIKGPHEKLLISIATKNRQDALLALLTSIFNQTYRNFDIFILDNSDDESLLKNQAVTKQLKLLNDSGNVACVWKNEPQNCPDTHQKILTLAAESNYKFIFKIDDDCILEKNTVEVLMNDIQGDNRIGAVGCPILEPGRLIDKIMPTGYPEQKLENIYTNRQWFWDKDMKTSDVEHLYSSFVYRTSALLESGGFPKGLSKVAFREETLTTYPMFLKGWKLHYNSKCLIWHMKADHGGCRDNYIEELYKSDDKIFIERINKMKEDNNA